MTKRIALLSLSLCLFSNVLAFAQDKPDSTTPAPPAAPPSEEAQAAALQKATQNPVANLISVPLQNNTAFNIGPYNRTQDVLNIQPVIPAHITKNWMLISRIIQPNVWTVPFGGGVGRIMKLGFQPVNITGEFFGNAAYPTGASPWGMRLQIAFLFPKFTPEQKKMLMEMQLKKLEEEQKKQPKK